MLEPVELLPARRKNPRHAHSFEVPVMCDLWDSPVPLVSRDVSVGGLYLETELPLDPGTEIVLELELHNQVYFVIGLVRRTELRGGMSGMGIELLDVDDELETELTDMLRHRPPALPRGPAPIQRRLIWVEAILTYEENLGDRVNVVEVSERLAIVEDDAEFEEAFSCVSAPALLC